MTTERAYYRGTEQ